MHEIIIIGCGFSGLNMGLTLHKHGETSFIILEQSPRGGGTWYDNLYPGCECDVPSHLYSLSIGEPYDWPQHYALRQDIWTYIQRESHRIGQHIRFQATVTKAQFDSATQCWQILLNSGEFLFSRFLINASGPLSQPNYSSIPNQESFTGQQWHTARWPEAGNWSNLRIALIGTGSSAIQVLPKLVPNAKSITLFQRTAPWVLPKCNRVYHSLTRKILLKSRLLRFIYRHYLQLFQELKGIAFLYPSLMKRLETRQIARLKKLIKDDVLRAKVTPQQSMGCQRIILSDEYYQSLQNPKVSLCTDTIVQCTRNGIETSANHQEFDLIIWATGFNYQAPTFNRVVCNAAGQNIEAIWGPDKKTYLGCMVASFPNYFMLLGPNTGSGHQSILIGMEYQTHWIIDIIQYAKQHRLTSFSVKEDRVQKAHEDIQRRFATTVWNQNCHGWYYNTGSKNTALWPGFTWSYRKKINTWSPNDFIWN